ncbi:ethylbenzene dehydrogenase-related protein [Alteromonas lipotrueae]|uniref:ethylbenzene dehydrogenase-related protein n=1 Tax=Alteromonas lipotrueae TaxID=2803814 RepID=UPI001C448B31|nr:ethylbenzene dehydrogenase-related protein [Alteromonas lipotrueae]
MKSRSLFLVSHFVVLICVVILLLSGLRIATLQHSFWLHVSWLLPQGLVHLWHILAASFLLLALPIMLWCLYNKRQENGAFKAWNKLGSYLLVVSCTTGLLQVFSEAAQAQVKWVHYYAALGLLLFFLLHPIRYYLTKPLRVLSTYLLSPFFNKQNVGLLLITIVIGAAISAYILSKPDKLVVYQIENDSFIRIDGKDDELDWQSANEVSIGTFGGANFNNGASKVSVKALHNESEIYFFIRWQDPSESLLHLPLIKTNKGWKVKENGFAHNNELSFYEDKFAMLLSKSCFIAAAGTAHLGANPLKGKPANTHKKGYHYSHSRTADLWHWKAVRTNNMFIMDDNFIGKPTAPIAGMSRYTAGYRQDSSLGGSYIMNWKWYSPKGIEPKRLPRFTETSAEGERTWFSYKAYSPTDDDYSVGSTLPSVLYRSNQLEGGRAHVRARGLYDSGYWHLEVVRKKQTQDDLDIAVEDGVCMWLSAFDHAQIAHTRHVRPLQLRYQTQSK